MKKYSMYLVIVMSLVVSGCSQLRSLSPLAKNFDSITVGTSKDAVEELIGTPDKSKSLKIAMVDVEINFYHSWLTGQDYIVAYGLNRVVGTAEF